MGAFLSKILCNGIGYLGPAYYHYKIFNQENTQGRPELLSSYNKHWIVISIYTTIETFTDIFIYWIPFYYALKLLFICWMSFPLTNVKQVNTGLRSCL